MSQLEQATLFRRLHLEPPLLVLPNAWDVASAKVLAALPGCRALATSSAAVARSLGFEDGENAPAAAMIEANSRIAEGRRRAGDRGPGGRLRRSPSRLRAARGTAVSSGSTSRIRPAGCSKTSMSRLRRSPRFGQRCPILSSTPASTRSWSGTATSTMRCCAGTHTWPRGRTASIRSCLPGVCDRRAGGPHRRADQRPADAEDAVRLASSPTWVSPASRGAAGWPGSPTPRRRVSLRPRSAVNDARGAPTRDVAERPPGQHHEPVLETDQVEEVQAEPEHPRREAGEVQSLDVRDRPRPRRSSRGFPCRDSGTASSRLA